MSQPNLKPLSQTLDELLTVSQKLSIVIGQALGEIGVAIAKAEAKPAARPSHSGEFEDHHDHVEAKPNADDKRTIKIEFIDQSRLAPLDSLGRPQDTSKTMAFRYINVDGVERQVVACPWFFWLGESPFYPGEQALYLRAWNTKNGTWCDFRCSRMIH